MSKANLPKRRTPADNNGAKGQQVPMEYSVDYPPALYEIDEPESGGGGDQFARVIDMLYRRRWYVISGFISILILTAVYTYTRVPQFEATSYVTVDLGSVTLDIGKQLTASEEGGDASFELFARSDRSLSGEIRLLQISDQLELRVAERLLQDKDRGLLGGTSDLRLPRVRVVPTAERGADNIIRFTGRSSSPDHAARVVNLYSEEYVKLTQEASKAQSLALRESLEEKEVEQREELAAVEDQIKRLKLQGTIALDQEASRLVEQIADLDLERDNVLVEQRVDRATLESLENELANINPQIARRIASGVEGKLETLQAQLAQEEEARSKIIIQNPELANGNTDALLDFDRRIERLNSEIDSLSLQFVNEVGAAGGITGSADGLNYAANLRQQISEKRINLDRLQARASQLDQRLAEYQRAMRNLPQQSMELAQLERTRLRIEQVYQTTTEQLQQVLVAEDSNTGYAQIVRRAQIPTWSMYPDKPRNLILGGFFGLLLGLGIAIIRDKLDTRIFQTEQLREMGLKEIGVIPDMYPLIEKEYGDQESLLLNGQNFSTKLVTYLNPVSTTAETYRHIRTLIQYGLTGRRLQTLLITSPNMSEGKSTTAANLAIVMAQAGLRTLLIDADLRRPNLHKLFGVPRDGGLVEILSDSEMMNPGNWHTSIENLSLLTAGAPLKKPQAGVRHADREAIEPRRAIILNPSELLGSEQMIEAMGTLREQFDMIIVDTPPVMVATDAAVLSAHSDATMVVARANQTKEAELNMAVESLESVGAEVLGVVLNGFDINMAFGHRYKYQKYGRFAEYGYYGTRD